MDLEMESGWDGLERRRERSIKMQQAWHVSEEETVVDVPFREIVGSLMWIANQTRPDIANAVRAIARFSHDPKPIHYKAAQKILKYLMPRRI